MARRVSGLQEQGRLAAEGLARLERLVADRLAWETFAELGYRSTIGRTERTRTVVIGVDGAAFGQASRRPLAGCASTSSPSANYCRNPLRR